MSELDDIRAELTDIQRTLARKKSKPRDKRPNFNLRMNRDEAEIFLAACTQRGMTRSDLLRAGLNSILGTDFPLNRKTPAELAIWHNRRKPPDIVHQAIGRRMELIAAGSARHSPTPVPNEMMLEPPSASPLAQGMLTERKR